MSANDRESDDLNSAPIGPGGPKSPGRSTGAAGPGRRAAGPKANGARGRPTGTKATAGPADQAVREQTIRDAELSGFRRLAVTAADPFEIAATLESQGVNDRIARDRFGAHDVFTLADTLFGQRSHRPGGKTRSAGAGGGVPDPGAPGGRDPGAEARGSAGPEGPDAIPVRMLLFRGLLYVVPAFVSLSLLRSVDRAEAALLLFGLALSWAWGYGMAYLGWVFLGNRDPAGARWFLRRGMLSGIGVMALLSVGAIYATLVATTTTHVTLVTLSLLVGLMVYLLSAMVLLMLRHDLWLLIALLPAVTAGAFGLTTLGSGAQANVASKMLASVESIPGGRPAMAAVVGTVALAFVFALRATRGGTRPTMALFPASWVAALMQAVYGLLTAVLLLYPVLNELLNENGESLSLSVSLAALPLILSMGMAEVLLHRHRTISARLLGMTDAPEVFAHAARRAFARSHVLYLVTLTGLTALLCLGVAFFGGLDSRMLLLCADYLAFGAAIFTAMVLNALDRMRVVLMTFTAAAAMLIARSLHSDYMVTDTVAAQWFGVVGIALFLVHSRLIGRFIAQPVSHW